ncbi:NADH dehydrogenase [ubiquinone] 1 beta subcomplex subunit 9 isoform X1 [Nasonia vitripennis]|uniref:NADH dehydrogenase [ubiquinone] 1 beta subcomplex subunit 9 n=1 Tax=Nasonia vitripennis TaxID=7425 RepID=A0A7M6UVS2_NASVI|nr:NADH dehydrogenase [ubiquinone] 1 beta subcomplex subunit 9 [Nasonia vitripennis]XP_032453596.1 NADH dehydrogenase [ubiquinone] 1 beta subcomplex subunit 9 isoform X1 [Nasonia vitripennis]
MAHIPTGLVSHSRRVCNFYKRVLRHIESTVYCLDEVRYESVLMRAKFDENKNIKDLRVAKLILLNAEKELDDQRHWSYKKFPESPGGCAYQRVVEPPDWVLDYWDPMEKAAYPKYFALREQRKKEFEEFYRQEYGEPPSGHQH